MNLQERVKLAALETIIDNTKISNTKKKKMLKYIKEESTLQQDMGVILDSKIYNLNRKSEEIIEHRFLNEQTKKRKTVMSVAGLVLDPVDWLLYRTIRGAFDKCSKECGTYRINNAERQECLAKCKEVKDREMRKLKEKLMQKQKQRKDL